MWVITLAFPLRELIGKQKLKETCMIEREKERLDLKTDTENDLHDKDL